LRRFWQIVIAILANLAPAIVQAAEPLPRSVLVITQSSPSSAGATAIFTAFRSDPSINATSPIAVYTEHLDLNRFSSPPQRQLTRAYLHDKYRETPIGVVVVDGPIALDLVLSWRGDMWSEVPVVFYGLDEVSAAQLKLPTNVTGFVAHQTFQGMVDAARVLVPGFRRVALVGDPPGRDTYRRNYGAEIAALAAKVELIDLTGMAVTEVKGHVAVLPSDAVVFYTAIFVDGAGVVHTPQSALLAISGATSRPIITDVESQLGYGAVGGFLFSIDSAAREAVRLAGRILEGENASQIPVAKIDLNKPVFDGRELKRWNIRESRLPPGSDIRFRDPTFWQQHRALIFAALLVLVQAALIVWLIYEHRRRQIAESESLQRMNELARMNRFATAGEMSASIAHELRQPLAAIVMSGAAALNWLKKQVPDLNAARSALETVVSESHRADDVIKSVRAMFRHESSARAQINLNELIQEVMKITARSISSNDIVLNASLADNPPPIVMADSVQLQQVILNLIVNAVDAMSQRGHWARILQLGTQVRPDGTVLMTVTDSGPSSDPKIVEKMFQPLFTTKPGGMGMGLPICKTIVEAHGGTLTASQNKLHGMEFQVVLPLANIS
jgi:signal transduction histidine kinase